MKLIILLIFIAVPLAEIAVFIQVGGLIGILPTVALVFLTAIIGVALIKQQGLAAIARAQQTIDAGGMPVDSVIDGICLLVAGALLLTPGLITDSIGFLLLVPSLRHGLARRIMDKVKETGSLKVWTSGPGAPPRGGRPAGPSGARTIEGEYEDVTPPDRDESGKRRIPPGDKGSDGPDSPWRQ